MGKARLTSRDVVPRDSVTYRSTYRRRSWHRRAIMEEFIRRRAAACARNTAVGIAGLNRSVAYKLAQVFADATFIIKLLHISHTHRLSSSAGNRLYRHSKVLSHCNTSMPSQTLSKLFSNFLCLSFFVFSSLLFFWCDATHNRGLCRHALSVCLSVRHGSCQNESTYLQDFFTIG